MRSVIFDLDGTLADTSADLLAAANTTFENAGLGRPLDQGDTLVAFRGGRAMLRLGAERLNLGWSEDEITAQYPVLLDAYEAEIDRHTTIYPGAVEAIEALRRDGVAVGICTNKPDHLAEKLLRNLGLRDMFAAMIGANTLPVRKPDPAPLLLAIREVGGDPRCSCLIGDTDTDRNTGLAANVPVVLVTFGPEGEAISRLNPDALLHHYDALSQTVAPYLARG